MQRRRPRAYETPAFPRLRGALFADGTASLNGRPLPTREHADAAAAVRVAAVNVARDLGRPLRLTLTDVDGRSARFIAYGHGPVRPSTDERPGRQR